MTSSKQHEFTLDPLDWRPHVTPVSLDDATDEQRRAMAVTPSNTGVSPYVLALAHEPAALAERTPLFNDIMYARGGLGRGAREMGALAASVVNGCIYCAQVHASRHVQLEKRPESIAAIFADGDDARLPDADQVPFDFGVRLTTDPQGAGAADLQRLRQAGLDNLQVMDLIHSVAVFGWANRLMHTLGEAVPKGQE